MRKIRRILAAGRGTRALSLPEVMISLAITSMLLVAVAAAFTSSASAIENNDAFFRCSQAGRVTLNQILAEVRNCDSLDMSTPNTINVIRQAAVQGNQQYARQGNEVSRLFAYDTANKRITLTITQTTALPQLGPYELASHVTACSFGPPQMGLDYNNAEIPVRVPILLTVSTGGNTVTLDGSAAPRRAMKY